MKKVLSKFNKGLKNMMPLMVFISIILGIANLIFINKVEKDLAETKKEVVTVEDAVYEMTEEDPSLFAGSRPKLYQILNRIDEAEENIRDDIYRLR